MIVANLFDLVIDNSFALGPVKSKKEVSKQQMLVDQTFKSVSRRTDFMCNFIEGDGTSWEKGMYPHLTLEGCSAVKRITCHSFDF